jgi:hypothetical protein
MTVRNIVLSSTFVFAAAVLAIDARAAPRVPGGPGGRGGDDNPPVAVKKPVVRRLNAKLGERVQKPGKPAKTRAEILAMFEADSKETLPNGKTVTVQQLLDDVDDAEGELQKKGGSFHKMQKRTFMRADLPQVKIAQKTEHQNDLRVLATAARPVPTRPGMDKCNVMLCVPADTQHKIGWNKTLGHKDVVAAYTDFRVEEKTPDTTHASCNLTWDNGVFLLGEQKSIVKFVTDTQTQTGASPSSSAKASLYVLGSASPTWSKSTNVLNESLDRTFKTKKDMDYTIVPGIYLKGGIAAAATLGLKPTVDGTATKTQAHCGVNVTPSLRADLDPEVSLHVGIPKVADLAEGGLKANIAVVDAKLPTKLDVAISDSPRSLNVDFKSDLNVTFLKGKLIGWYKIHDICRWGFCLLEDGLGIDTSGEIELWEGDGFPYNTNLVDMHGPIAFKPAGGGGGAVMAR